MQAITANRDLSARSVEAIMEVTSKLATPIDLNTMLGYVVDAACQVLDAEDGLVWIYDPDSDELVLDRADLDQPFRTPSGIGVIGSCAQSHAIVRVARCDNDLRFRPEVDSLNPGPSRSLLVLPLTDHDDGLIGILQVFNKRSGEFDDEDERLAGSLAAQCVMALQRSRTAGALREAEHMRQELEMAREVQMSTLPDVMPEVDGYDLFGVFRPAGLTGGDTFDLIRIEQGLFILMGDATGHGIAPALSATQMQAMLRVAFRVGADLESAFMHVNNQLLEDLPDDRFVTAFVGLLDPDSHAIRFHSGGQGPILHYRAAEDRCVRYGPTSFPMAAAPLDEIGPAEVLDMAPGDILALLSDGIFEYCNDQGEQFGEERAMELIRTGSGLPGVELAEEIFRAVAAFAGSVPQADDMTVVLVKRRADPT